MPIDPETLSSLAHDYAQDMTSIRGRRVQRLLKREFAGADHVLLLQIGGPVARAVLGLSPGGAALCATDGRGKLAAIFKWVHGATDAREMHFDLLKDSLPVVAEQSAPLAGLGRRVHPLSREPVGGHSPEARALLAKALRALA